MTAIWQHDDAGWRLLSPSGFPSEATLHTLIEQAPHILPLAGNPNLVVLGSEVLLGGNYADLIAIDPSGQLAIIEIKLAKNPEARRAVVAQILTYAAYLRGLDAPTLEGDILSGHLQKHGYTSLTEAIAANYQEGAFDQNAFVAELNTSLADGRFRLVLVLDEAPQELVRLAGFLEAVSDTLVIDLVTVSAYEVNGTQLVVPQRVDPEQIVVRAPGTVNSIAAGKGRFAEGSGDFEEAISEAPADQQELLWRLIEWAKKLESDGLVTLGTYHGQSGRVTLLPRLHSDNVGLITVYNERSATGAYLQFWRSVITRRAPLSLSRLELLAAPAKIGQGTTTRQISDELLSALHDAYREAASGAIKVDVANED